VLYDAGASPDGVVENMRRLDIDPGSIEAIVCSHGHFDHTTGLDGLIRTLDQINMPVLIHPTSGAVARGAARPRTAGNTHDKPPSVGTGGL
jgi:metal-dependent hydrolase (beta-lactamase superfamily II)